MCPSLIYGLELIAIWALLVYRKDKLRHILDPNEGIYLLTIALDPNWQLRRN